MKRIRFVWTLLCIAAPAVGAQRSIPVAPIAQEILAPMTTVIHPADARTRVRVGAMPGPVALMDSSEASAAGSGGAAFADDPLLVAIAMFHAFEHGDVEGWVGAMAPDYRFDSNDPSFLARFPRGFGQEDERAFMTHLFRGGGRARDGSPLPVAVAVRDDQGPLWVEARDIGAAHATLHVRRFGPVLTMSDATCIRLGGTENVLELRRERGRWWVCAWHEHVSGEPDAGSLAAADSGAGSGHADVPYADAPTRPLRLAVRPLGNGAGGELKLAISLPAGGGELELFDVMGRRLARSDLAGMGAGSHTVALPARVPAGVYWVRVRQGGREATARVVRL